MINRYPANRCRYIGAYMVLECYRDVKIPIISVNVTAVAHMSAVATVHMHPNPFIHHLTRGINVYIVCEIMDRGAFTHPRNYVMFIGDVSSVQTSASSTRVEYIVNLVDNRRYIAELPTYYLKLMRTQYDIKLHTRTNEQNQTVFSIQDQYADANFFGIEGQYIEDTFYYDVAKEATTVMAFMEQFSTGTLHGYINKMLEPMQHGTGWEAYYVNMNKKKRITNHILMYDDGIFRSDISANFATAAATGAIHSIKNAHAELHTTYDDALGRLSDLGYLFNTNVFPVMSGGNTEELKAPSEISSQDDMLYHIKSTLFYGELLGIVINKKDSASIPPVKGINYWAGTGPVVQNGVEPIMVAANANIAIYSAEYGDSIYYAIVNREISTDAGGAHPKHSPQIREFSIVPKMYGVVPPRCNWGVVDENITFSCVISEPPITALKYNLREGNSGSSMFTYAYPGNLMMYSYPERDHAAYAPTVIEIGPRKQIGKSDWLYLVAGQTVTETTQGHANRSHADLQGGIDIAMAEGTGIPSYTDGTVTHVFFDPNAKPRDKSTNGGWGNQIYIQSMGTSGVFTWCYNHLRSVYVKRGDIVRAGQLIGAAGQTGHSTGTHLHLQIKDSWGRWVNTTYLFKGTGLTPPRVIKYQNKAYDKIVAYNLYQITSTTFSPKKDPGEEVISTISEAPPVNVAPPGADTMDWRKTYPTGYHPDEENIYGVRRVSTSGSALYELVKASQYLEGDGSTDIPTMSADNKIAMLRAKVVQDYHESRVSRNTGTISIEGIDEHVMVGFPYLLYHPRDDIFYYGFVEEVSHRIDNSSGQAYTQIALSSVTTAYSIREIEMRFSGYTKIKYVKEEGLSELNKVYAPMTMTTIKPEEYRMLDLYATHSGGMGLVESPSTPEQKRASLLSLMGRGMNYRPICTIERLQNYMYNNKRTVPVWNDVAGSESKSNQWMTETMKKTVDNILMDYRSRLTTQNVTFSSPLPDLDEQPETLEDPPGADLVLETSPPPGTQGNEQLTGIPEAIDWDANGGQ